MLRRPQLVPAPSRRGLPSEVTIYEVGPRDGLQNESAMVPLEVKAEFIRPACGLRPVGHRGDELRASEVGAAAGRRRGAGGPHRSRRGAADAGAGAQRARPRAGDRCRRARDRRLRQRDRDVRPDATSTAAWRASSRCSSRSWPAPSMPGCGCAPTCRCASATRGRATSRSPTSWRVSRRLLDLGCHELSLGDTIGVATPGHVSALLAALGRGRYADRADRRAFPRHVRSGAVQRADGAAARGDDLRRVGRRARRLPVRRERDRQSGHRGPGLAAARAGDRDRRRPRCAGRDDRLDGRADRQASRLPGRHRPALSRR